MVWIVQGRQTRMQYFERNSVATCSSLLRYTEQHLRNKSDLSAKCLFEDLDQRFSNNLVLFDEVLTYKANLLTTSG